MDINPLPWRYGTRVDYVFCGQGVKTQWEVTDAWHCQTTSDHNAVYVVFNRNPNTQDPSNCSQLQEQEDLGEDLWGVSSKTADGDVRIRKGKRRPLEMFMSGYYQLQKIETDIFSSAPAYDAP